MPSGRTVQVYDVRNPNGNPGFSWDQIARDWRNWPTKNYVAALDHPIAQAGFDSDYDAMKWADTCIFLMPCGNSASMELGWMAGAGKKTIVHFPEEKTNPDLMVKMATYITTDYNELYHAIKGD